MPRRPADITLLRDLVKQYLALCAAPAQRERRDAWRAHNSLRPTRPLIYARAFAWQEMSQAALRCTDPFFRPYENTLRHAIFWNSLDDDSIFEPWLTFPAVKTASGLIYKSQKEGTGTTPAASDTVKVHYNGALVNGVVFDSSYKRGQPAEFPLNGVIKCWTEGVQMMKPGGKARLICPPDIAYGDRGAGTMVPPKATLVFDVELLEVKKEAKPEVKKEVKPETKPETKTKK